MVQIIIFILGVLIGGGFVWLAKHTCKSRQKFTGGLIGLNKKRKEEARAQKDHILKFVKEQGRITNDDTQELLGVSDSTATRRLNDLEAEGFLVENGAGKKIYYELGQ
jgi:Fic family protein